MPLNLSLAATLVASPPSSTDGGLPSGVTNISFGLNPSTKMVNVDTGAMTRQINSPSDYITLEGVPSTVSQGTTLFIRTTAPFLFRLTNNDPITPTQAILPINGTVLLEFPADKYLTLLEAQGSGTIEYYIGGAQ